MGRSSGLWHPGKVPEIRAGYWWHAENATGFSTTGFSVPDGNGSTKALVQATVASQPTLLREKNTNAFRMRNAADSNPSLIGSATFQAGWTTATYIAGWFRLPSGTPTGNGALAQHNTTTGNQNRHNFSISVTGLTAAVSSDGISGNIKSNLHSGVVFNDLQWHFCEYMFIGTGSTEQEKMPVFVDFSQQARTNGTGSIPSSALDATAGFGVGCRFQNSLANVDTTDWCSVYYGNGIPKLSHRIALSRFKPPT